VVSLEAHVVDARRGVDVSITVAAGETLALMGPNGAGKSTVLGAVAGLVRTDTARVSLDGRALAGDGIQVPAHRRSIVLLGQDPRLFPHLTVQENVAFGPRSRRDPDARDTAVAWLERVGLADLADRRPRQLSGGQAQRVAIARALAVEPAVVLLDEPLAALDVEAVPEVRRLLRTVLADRTAVLVTHEPLDALSLADRVTVVESGRVVDEGDAGLVLTHPRSAFGAALAGVNLVEAVAVAADAVRTADGRELVGVPAAPLTVGGRATATFSPAAVAVHRIRPEGSPRNVLGCEITGLEHRGGTCRVSLGDWVADLTTASVARLGLEPGDRVWLSLKATEVRLEPA